MPLPKESTWAEGYRALMIVDTAFYRNLQCRASGDTPETLDYVRTPKVIQEVFEVVRSDADARLGKWRTRSGARRRNLAMRKRNVRVD